jgi:flavin reductase (DIM6/NTAB) family NADH-FMN oxidoreductase RutF
VPAPQPGDEYDRRRRRVLWRLPTGLYVLGSAAGGRRNLMTLNWATQVATAPKLVAVSVESAAVTHRLVREGGAFTLNLLAREDRALVRRFVKPVEDTGEEGLLAGQAVEVAASGAPVLSAAVAWLDCRLYSELALGSHSLFVGEVLDCGERVADAEVLRMEDTRMSYGG